MNLYDALKSGTTEEDLIKKFTDELREAKSKIDAEDARKKSEDEYAAKLADARYELADALVAYAEVLANTSFEDYDLYIDGVEGALMDLEDGTKPICKKKQDDEFVIYEKAMDQIVKMLTIAYDLDFQKGLNVMESLSNEDKEALDKTIDELVQVLVDKYL